MALSASLMVTPFFMFRAVTWMPVGNQICTALSGGLVSGTSRLPSSNVPGDVFIFLQQHMSPALALALSTTGTRNSLPIEPWDFLGYHYWGLLGRCCGGLRCQPISRQPPRNGREEKKGGGGSYPIPRP